MNEREQISALVDDELSPAERDALVARMESDTVAADTWRRYHVVRAAVQREAFSGVDLSSRIMAALDDEAVVLAPRALPASKPLWRQRWVQAVGAFAVAATLVIGVGIPLVPHSPTSSQVEILGMLRDGNNPQVLVSPDQSAPDADPVQRVALNDTDRENAYVLAHAEYAFRGDDGITPYARVAGQTEE